MTTAKQAPNWHEAAAALKLRTQAFIDGDYRDASSGETFDCISPADGRTIAQVASCAAADVDAAVASARRSFEAGGWSRESPAGRKRVLRRFSELLLANCDELALTETLDMGKPISDSLAIDVPGAARCMEWYAEAVDKVYDEVAPTSRSTLAMITREPIGVVGAIVPWNFPLLMACWKLGPALATGNSVVRSPRRSRR
jgi:4-guanidinobutyraldehyde dehydrogenase/NAD-dependent aldehyde dehydrogenase